MKCVWCLSSLPSPDCLLAFILSPVSLALQPKKPELGPALSRPKKCLSAFSFQLVTDEQSCVYNISSTAALNFQVYITTNLKFFFLDQCLIISNGILHEHFSPAKLKSWAYFTFKVLNFCFWLQLVQNGWNSEKTRWYHNISRNRKYYPLLSSG